MQPSRTHAPGFFLGAQGGGAMRIGARALGSAVLAWACVLAGEPALAAEPGSGARDFNAEAPSEDARAVARWVLDSHDNHGLPFAIVDKRQARLFVFAADGQIVGASAALLGQANGDDAVPGLGAREPAQILPAERTTPAGRFASEPGRNLNGEAVVWFDYHAGLAIHRLRPGASRQRREQGLASTLPADRRVSLGCIVVDESFYDGVVRPLLGQSRGVVYVLPETRVVAELFGAYRVSLQRGD